MNLKVLALPELKECPACYERIEQTFIVPVVSREQNRVKLIVAACPNCGTGFDLDLDEIMKAAACEAVNHLSVAATLSFAFM